MRFAQAFKGLERTDTVRDRIVHFLRPNAMSFCGRCRRRWNQCDDHTTYYSSDRDDGFNDRGIFPLCQDCWLALRTPEARWPYYEAIINLWIAQMPEHTDEYERARVSIRSAVLAGG